MIDIERMKRLSGIQSEDELRATALRLLQTCLEESAAGNKVCFAKGSGNRLHTALRWDCFEHAREVKGD